MPVRKTIPAKDGVYFITLTCAQWLPLFKISDSYTAVYNWFNYLKENGHYIIGYVIMPDHLHTIIAFHNTGKTINSIVGNGKRFMAYEIVKNLKRQHQNNILLQLQSMVNNTQQLINKQHEIFEPSFDWKECRTVKFIEQKLQYIHWNPCKGEKKLVDLPEQYEYSSARFYLTGSHAAYSVISYMELQDINLTA